jgi:hypothetical protein
MKNNMRDIPLLPEDLEISWKNLEKNKEFMNDFEKLLRSLANK